jgi:small GTP-binding protein
MTNEESAKVVLLGDTNVGKTTIHFHAIMGHAPDSNRLAPTIAGTKAHYSTNVDGRLVSLTLWDTAGQENYRSLIPAYVRGAAVVVYVYSITQPVTFNSINDWVRLVHETCEVRGQVLLANKSDLADGSADQISTEAGIAMAEKIGTAYFEVSGVTGYGISNAMTEIARRAAGRPTWGENLIPTTGMSGIIACCR